ncbi:MAG: 4Fe-4S dicluster domain-containing protein [Candidatus Hodarchaeales archaeon]
MATVKQLGILVDLGRCIGCKTCIVACRNYKGLTRHDYIPNPDDPMPYYIRVESKRTGTYPDISVDNWVLPCQHCADPECIKACPEKISAISKNDSGVVLIDQEKCIGCQKCVEACPYNVIVFDKGKKKAHKCDLCWEKIQQGLLPVCVETCQTDALTFGELEILKVQAKAKGKTIVKELSKESIIYVK